MNKLKQYKKRLTKPIKVHWFIKKKLANQRKVNYFISAYNKYKFKYV